MRVDAGVGYAVRGVRIAPDRSGPDRTGDAEDDEVEVLAEPSG